MADDLDQIGRIQLPNFSSYWNKELFPSLPQFGNLPQFGTFPNLPQLPHFSGMPQLPTFPPKANFPSFDLTEFSRHVSQYINEASTEELRKQTKEARLRFMNSMKTTLATRIQMNTFLSDLKGGRSLQAAIDRLRPLMEVVHEAITLPADDEDDDDGEESGGEIDTEPVGVGAIVNREQPLMTDLVAPEGSEIHGLLNPSQSRRRKHRHKLRRSILSDGHDSSVYTGSDLDQVDELTPEEVRALTHLESLDEFFEEDLLRQKIQRIHAMDNLSHGLKNKLVTKLMMGNYYRYINEKLKSSDQMLRQTELMNLEDPVHEDGSVSEDSNFDNGESDMIEEVSGLEDDEVVLTEEDQTCSWHDESRQIMGCSHYMRSCKLECPTCNKWFVCRFCHDAAVQDHKLARAEVKHVLCMKCNTPQEPDTNYCANCKEELANYFCRKCVLYDNDPNKDIYHCDKCGICRLGLGLGRDYFHCDRCNICLSIDLKEHHKCVSNTTHCNCPICNEYLFTSVSKVVFMKCGHLIHQTCYDEMIKHQYKCPVCKKTVVNAEAQFRVLDQEIRQLPLPAPYNMWRCIISCNDCKGKSNCAYHVIGLKCKYCQSYNTTQLKVIKPEEEDDEEPVEADRTDVIASMRLVKTNLSSNFIIDDQGYTGEDDNDNEEDNDDDNENDHPFRRLTLALLGNRDVDKTSVTAMFQNFINSAVKENENASDSDMEIFGGF